MIYPQFIHNVDKSRVAWIQAAFLSFYFSTVSTSYPHFLVWFVSRETGGFVSEECFTWNDCGWWVGCDLRGEFRGYWIEVWKKIGELDFGSVVKRVWKRRSLKRCFISRALFLCFVFLWFIFVFVSRETLRLWFWYFRFWICFTWNSTVVLKPVLLVWFLWLLWKVCFSNCFTWNKRLGVNVVWSARAVLCFTWNIVCNMLLPLSFDFFMFCFTWNVLFEKSCLFHVKHLSTKRTNVC